MQVKHKGMFNNFLLGNSFLFRKGDDLARPAPRRGIDPSEDDDERNRRPSPAMLIGGLIIAAMIIVIVLVMVIDSNSVSSIVVGNVEKEIDGIEFPVYTSVNGFGEYNGNVKIEIYYENMQEPIYSGKTTIKEDSGRHQVNFMDFVWGNGDYQIHAKADGISDKTTIRIDSVADTISPEWKGYNADFNRMTHDHKVEITVGYMFGNRTSPAGDDPQVYTFKGEVLTSDGSRIEINSTEFPTNLLKITEAMNHTTKGTYKLTGQVINEFCHPNSPYRTVNVDLNSNFIYDASPFAMAGDDIETDLSGGEAIVELDASGSWDDSAIVEYKWYIGDEAVETTSSPTLSYTFTSAGTYYVALGLVDDGGNSSDENAELSTLAVIIN